MVNFHHFKNLYDQFLNVILKMMENENIIVECQHLQAKKGLKKFSTFRIVFFFQFSTLFSHSPKKRKDSLETRAV